MSSSTITSSGVGSGTDFESIISASVSAKNIQDGDPKAVRETYYYT